MSTRVIVYLTFLVVLGPPVYLALLPPRTEKWRRARKWFWRLFPVVGGLFYVNLAFLDPAGPGWLYYGAWFVFVVVMAFWCIALGSLKSEWSDWREANRPPEEPTEPAPVAPAVDRKPWEK